MTARVRDAVVVGGGPAGLAFAAFAAERGLDVLVLERREGPLDKACGEGLLPAGVRALEPLGILARVDAADRALLRAIRWIDAVAGEARLALPPPGGVAIRRTALSAALLERAREAGAEVRQGAAVVRHRRRSDAIVAEGPFGEAAARVLVAADGLNSPTRRREGLALPPRLPARYGIRRHFAVSPWSEEVEVHFGERTEAYVWPSGPERGPPLRAARVPSLSPPGRASPTGSSSSVTPPGTWTPSRGRGSRSRSAARRTSPRSFPRRSPVARAQAPSAPTRAPGGAGSSRTPPGRGRSSRSRTGPPCGGACSRLPRRDPPRSSGSSRRR